MEIDKQKKLRIAEAMQDSYWARKRADGFTHEALAIEVGISSARIVDVITHSLIRSKDTLDKLEAYLAKQEIK